MILQKRVDLYEYFGVKRPDGAQGYLDVLAYDKQVNYAVGRVRPAMLVIAGGGYGYVSPREQYPVALKYVNEGFNAYLLDYSVEKMAKYPTPVIEAVMALLYIRETSGEYGTDPEKVCGVGFSAGGHLVGMLATAYNNKEIREVLGDKVDNARLDAVIFSYAVILTENTHVGSIQNITGGDKSLLKTVAVSENVNANTPPAFIWATVNDGAVPSESSLELACAYKRAGVPFELHMFENGTHGLSIANAEVNSVNEPVSKWVKLSLTWLKQRGFIHRKVEE